MAASSWSSVVEIVSEFRLTAPVADLDSIILELKSKRAELHPDKNGGMFSNDAEAGRYHRLDDAIAFVENQGHANSSLVPIAYISEIVKTAVQTALAPGEKHDSIAEQTQFLDDSRRQVIEHYTLPRFTSGILSAIFCGIIAMSDKLKDNPIFAPLMRLRAFPYLMWTALVFSGTYFAVTWKRERDEKNRAEELMSDGGLLQAFSSFCQDLFYRGQKSANVWEFGKLEYALSFQRPPTDFSYHLRMMLQIRKREETAESINRRWFAGRLLDDIATILKRSSSLSPPLAERLAEIHIRRLVDRKIIRRALIIDLDDRYEIDRETLEQIRRR